MTGGKVADYQRFPVRLHPDLSEKRATNFEQPIEQHFL